jgi:3-oxoacyl-[acyl-carrier protein] reductase
VSDLGSCKKLIEEVVSAYGGIDILVNNAGISGRGGATTPDDEFEAIWQRTMAINLASQAYLIRAALPHLQASGAGRVVNIASTEAIIATGGGVAYTASKHGVVGLTKSFAVELGVTGVTFNCVCPGPVDTGMTANIPPEAKQIYARRRVPLRRYADPEELAHGILNLVLPAASYINGAVLVVDGGLTIRHT